MTEQTTTQAEQVEQLEMNFSAPRRRTRSPSIPKEKVEESSKMLKVRFHYSEKPGGTFSPLYQLKRYDFVDDQEYTLPKKMIDDINSNCKVVIRSGSKKDKEGIFKKSGRTETRAYFEILG